jgi:nitrogen fixation-related uncharacterized protein
MRALLAIVLVAIVAGLIAAAILLATDAGQSTDLGSYLSDNANQAIDNFEQFIQDNLGQ